MLLLALAIAPGLAICVYILYRDVYNREPAINMIMSFVWGILIIVPAITIETLVGRQLDNSVISILLGAYIGVALVEECSKFLILRYYCFTRRSFDEPLDGIVYSVLISMGFATVENVFYTYEHGYSVAFLRMFTSVPAHATFAIIMGYYVGKAKFEHSQRRNLMLRGVLTSTLIHGTYDTFLLLGENAWIKKYVSDLLLFTLAIGSLYVAVTLSRKLIRVHHLTSKQLFHATPEITLRRASDEDILLIRELSLQVWPATYENILSKDQIDYMLNLMYSEAALHQQMNDDHHFFVVYNAGIPIGFASYGQVDPGIYKLHKIYLLSLQQGRGTGRYVIEQIIDRIREEGATLLRLNVNRNNKAKEFYEKLGFTAVREEDVPIGNGYFMNDYVMEKELRIKNESRIADL